MSRVKTITMTVPRATADKITVSTTSAQSAALPVGGDYVFVCDQGCSIVEGANPTATTSHPRIPANTMIRLTNMVAGEKLAVIADAAGAAHLWPDT